MKDHQNPLLTDLYQLAMAQARFLDASSRDAEGVFQLSFRKAPFGGPLAIAAGVQDAIADLLEARFTDEDLAWLGGDDVSLPAAFEAEFLDSLRAFPSGLEIDAVPEGSVVLPGVPMVRVKGPLWQAQLAETFLLNRIGFETLIATKAARIVAAADGAPVLEFGARRAQGPDAALRAARAAWIGGVAGTSNVLAAKTYGIPVRGTHAHSWVQSFAREGVPTDATERDAFRAFATAYPSSSVLLVDTYDTLRGVRNAIVIARELRARGHELVGIRLDSGDMDALSKAARRMLDQASFPNVKIVSSDSLDESKIARLMEGGAPIDTFGVGTALVTGGDQSSLGVVYKLSAVRETKSSEWAAVMKLSAVAGKRSLPGDVKVVRVAADGVHVKDQIGLDTSVFDRDGAPLLRPAARAGRLEPGYFAALIEARRRASAELARVPAAVRAGATRVNVEILPEVERLSEALLAEVANAAKVAG